MIPKTYKNNLELFVIQPLFKKVTTYKKIDGKRVAFKEDKFVKEHWLKVWMDKDDLTIKGEYINSKGEIAKSRCTVFNRSNNNYHIIGHSLDELNAAIKGMDKSIGFKTNY